MNQFLCDQIDQLDLAIDQLAVRDRNFDRFALMLIDNVVELVLHEHATNALLFTRGYHPLGEPKPEWRAVVAATGRSFDDKVSFARSSELVPPATADSIAYLHTFRNLAYHQGSRQEAILHSLAVVYLRIACSVLLAYRPGFYGIHSQQQISLRAIKYLGRPDFFRMDEAFQSAFTRMAEVAGSLTENLVDDLQADMLETVERVDGWLDFIEENGSRHTTRNSIVRDSQAWPMAFSDAGRRFAEKQGFTVGNTPEDFNAFTLWLSQHYPWQVRTDPIRSWKRRHAALKRETNQDAALKKYCDYMQQTQSFRDALKEGASELEAQIQQEIDRRRGK